MPRRTIDVIDHESWIMGVLEPIVVLLVLGIIAVMIGLLSLTSAMRLTANFLVSNWPAPISACGETAAQRLHALGCFTTLAPVFPVPVITAPARVVASRRGSTIPTDP